MNYFSLQIYQNQDFTQSMQNGVDKNKLEQFFQQLKFDDQKQIQDMTFSKAKVPNSKFDAIKTEIEIKSDLLTVVQQDQQIKDYENKNGWKVYKFIFASDEDKNKLINYKEQQPEKLVFLVHTIKDVPVIKLREVFCVREIIYDKENNNVKVYNQNVDYQQPLYQNAIISTNMTIKTYQQQDSIVKVTQYQFVDPKGSVPASIYNMALTKMAGMLQELKNQIEK